MVELVQWGACGMGISWVIESHLASVYCVPAIILSMWSLLLVWHWGWAVLLLMLFQWEFHPGLLFSGYGKYGMAFSRYHLSSALPWYRKTGHPLADVGVVASADGASHFISACVVQVAIFLTLIAVHGLLGVLPYCDKVTRDTDVFSKQCVANLWGSA